MCRAAAPPQMPTAPSKKVKGLVVPCGCGHKCDQCDYPAVVKSKISRELYCEYHSPAEPPKRDARQEHSMSVKLMTSMRVDAGLCGVVTSGPYPSLCALPRVDGAVTLALRGASASEKHGIRHMPELCAENMGPILLHDNVTVWSRVMSNGIHSLRWYDQLQTVEASDAMGAKMRNDYSIYTHKCKYPGFPRATASQLSSPILRFAPLCDAAKDDLVIFDPAMSELVWYGATMTRLEARSLFCALYARIAEPMLYNVRRRIMSGVSFHVAGSFTFTDTPATHFRDTRCSFHVESCVVCILQGVAPWDDYILERCATNDVFEVVVSLFFGERYKRPSTV